MTNQRKKSKRFRNVMILLLSLLILAIAAYFMMSSEQRRQLFETVGIENSEVVDIAAPESFVSIRNVTSRHALLGDDWVIKGQLFNIHESRAIKKVKVMFNFDDGVETLWLNEVIPPQGSEGKKIKERISGHGNSEFHSISVLKAEY